MPGLRLFSIQKNGGFDELTQIAGKFEVTDHLCGVRPSFKFNLKRGSGTGPILLSQATFLLAHIANSGPVPLSGFGGT